MNNIITLKRLAELLANANNCHNLEAEAFVNALTTAMREALAQGETVKVKGVGTFSVSGNKVEYVADPELAEAINEPFSMFSPEPLAPDLNPEDLKEPIQPIANQSESTVIVPESGDEKAPETEEIHADTEERQEDTVEEESQIEEPQHESSLKQEPEPEEPQVELQQDSEAEHEEEPVAISPIDIKENNDEKEDEYEESQEEAYMQSSRPSTFWLAWAVAIGFLIGLAVGFFVHDPIQEALEPSLAEDYEYPEEIIEETEEPEAEAVQPENEADTQVRDSKAPVLQAEAPIAETTKAEAPQKSMTTDTYDTIREGNSLAHMAKKHYGANVYWVYIYLENQDAIGNPNKVAVGTKLRIPSLEKYATQSTEQERREAAQKKVNEILKKYPR